MSGIEIAGIALGIVGIVVSIGSYFLTTTKKNKASTNSISISNARVGGDVVGGNKSTNQGPKTK